MAVVYRHRVDTDVHDLCADLGMIFAGSIQQTTDTANDGYSRPLRGMKPGRNHRPEGDNRMNIEYGCMHNRHGYFIGHWAMGDIKRMSQEYFPDAHSCMKAIRTRNWTRRTTR